MTNTVWVSKIEDDCGDLIELNGVFETVESTKVKHHNHNKYRLNENIGGPDELVYVSIDKSIRGRYLTFTNVALNKVA